MIDAHVWSFRAIFHRHDQKENLWDLEVSSNGGTRGVPHPKHVFASYQGWAEDVVSRLFTHFDLLKSRFSRQQRQCKQKTGKYRDAGDDILHWTSIEQGHDWKGSPWTSDPAIAVPAWEPPGWTLKMPSGTDYDGLLLKPPSFCGSFFPRFSPFTTDFTNFTDHHRNGWNIPMKTLSHRPHHVAFLSPCLCSCHLAPGHVFPRWETQGHCHHL